MNAKLGEETRLNKRRKDNENKAVEETLKKLDTLAILGEDRCYNSKYYQGVDVKRFTVALKERQALKRHLGVGNAIRVGCIGGFIFCVSGIVERFGLFSGICLGIYLFMELLAYLCIANIANTSDCILAENLAKQQREMINRYREVLLLYAELSIYKGAKVVSIKPYEQKGYDDLEETALLEVEIGTPDNVLGTVMVPKFYFYTVTVGQALRPKEVNFDKVFDLAEYWYLFTITRLEKDSILLQSINFKLAN